MIEVRRLEFLESLDKYIAKVDRKLKYMVVSFAYDVTLIASEQTPIGDQESIEKPGKYQEWYRTRKDLYGIPMITGYHKGAWRYSESGNFASMFSPIINETETTAGLAKQEAKASYSLGDTFYIGAAGPAYADLENGDSTQAPDGIMEPTMAELMSITQVNLQYAFDQG